MPRPASRAGRPLRLARSRPVIAVVRDVPLWRRGDAAVWGDTAEDRVDHEQDGWCSDGSQSRDDGHATAVIDTYQGTGLLKGRWPPHTSRSRVQIRPHNVTRGRTLALSGGAATSRSRPALLSPAAAADLGPARSDPPAGGDHDARLPVPGRLRPTPRQRHRRRPRPTLLHHLPRRRTPGPATSSGCRPLPGRRLQDLGRSPARTEQGPRHTGHHRPPPRHPAGVLHPDR